MHYSSNGDDSSVDQDMLESDLLDGGTLLLQNSDKDEEEIDKNEEEIDETTERESDSSDDDHGVQVVKHV
jgi:hypothetical protein